MRATSLKLSILSLIFTALTAAAAWSADPVIVDNTDAAFSTIGTWTVSDSVSGFYGTNYATAEARAYGDEDRVATWTFQILARGEYQIEVRWTAETSRHESVGYGVYNNGELIGGGSFDQRIDGGEWKVIDLGPTVPLFNEGTLEVKLPAFSLSPGEDEGGNVCADAVRVTLVQALPLHALVVDDVGNVGIGTASPTKKLHVDGDVYVQNSIDCYDITVRNPAGGADFVFEENYRMPNLNEVEAFIEKNKRLPEIPSSADMLANGISVPKMLTKHLQKIEELTLYMIELKNDNTKLKAENGDLRVLVNNLEKRMSEIEAQSDEIEEITH